MAYTIMLSSYQIGLITQGLDCIKNTVPRKELEKEPGDEGGGASENRAEELDMLTGLFKGLPPAETADTGMVHGFCL